MVTTNDNPPSDQDPPATPEIPAASETPATPETPDASETPATPATPETPAAPETPAKPDTPAASETPAAPATPETPAAPETPATPATPAAASPAAPASTAFRDQGGFGGSPPAEEYSQELSEKVVFINRCAKVVKGGRRFSFSALVVAGDHAGKVGYGFGKAKEVAECIRKASDISKRNLQTMVLSDNTIPHEIYAEFGGGKVLLKPASPGTGIIAGGGVRAVCEAVGIKDVLGKSLGSNNPANVVKATLKALSLLRSRDEVMKLRGKNKQKAI